MSPFKAFPHQPFHTPTVRAPPNRGMDSLPEVLHHCKTTSNRIVQKWPGFFFLSRTPSVRWFLFSKNRLVILTLRVIFLRFLRWGTSKGLCCSSVGESLICDNGSWCVLFVLWRRWFDAKKAWCFVKKSCIGEDIGCSQMDIRSEIWCYLLYQDGTDDVIMYLSWFFVGAEKRFSSVENPMLLSPPWRYTCSPPAIWHLAAETPGFCTPQRA